MKPKNVDEYIQSFPKEMQSRLNRIRGAIREVAPRAEEKISYAMPYYGYYGRLAYFQHSSKHVGLYIPGSVLTEFRTELLPYSTSTATIRFPHNARLPILLIKKLIKARLKQNEREWKSKQTTKMSKSVE